MGDHGDVKKDVRGSNREGGIGSSRSATNRPGRDGGALDRTLAEAAPPQLYAQSRNVPWISDRTVRCLRRARRCWGRSERTPPARSPTQLRRTSRGRAALARENMERRSQNSAPHELTTLRACDVLQRPVGLE